MIKTLMYNKKIVPLVLYALFLPLAHIHAGIFDITIESPISNFTTVEQVVTALLQALVTIAIPIIVLMIIYAGFLYVTAQGNAEQVKKATTALTYAVIGGVLVVGAVAITEIIELTTREFRTSESRQ